MNTFDHLPEDASLEAFGNSRGIDLAVENAKAVLKKV